MNKRGSAGVMLIVAIVVVLLIVGAVWYYKWQSTAVVLGGSSQSAASTTTQQVMNQASLSSICPQASNPSLLAFEDGAEGFAFCYPSSLTISTDTNSINVGTHRITWPTPYKDAQQGIINPSLSFVTTQSNPSLLLASLAQCDLSGSRGDYWCDPPKASQMMYGTSTGGLSFAWFRTDFELNHNVVNTSTGPYAYVDLGSSTYLIFQAPIASLPSYIDADLQDILNTVQVVH